jgi:hypothetical protein
VPGPANGSSLIRVIREIRGSLSVRKQKKPRISRMTRMGETEARLQVRWRATRLPVAKRINRMRVPNSANLRAFGRFRGLFFTFPTSMSPMK